MLNEVKIAIKEITSFARPIEISSKAKSDTDEVDLKDGVTFYFKKSFRTTDRARHALKSE